MSGAQLQHDARHHRYEDELALTQRALDISRALQRGDDGKAQELATIVRERLWPEVTARTPGVVFPNADAPATVIDACLEAADELARMG